MADEVNIMGLTPIGAGDLTSVGRFAVGTSTGWKVLTAADLLAAIAGVAGGNVTLAAGRTLVAANTLLPASFCFAIGENATADTDLTPALVIPCPCTLVGAYIYAKTAPTGAALIIDVNRNGSTIWATQGNRLSLPIAAQSANTVTFNQTAFVRGDVLTIDCDQIGSTIPGKDVTVLLVFVPTGGFA